MLKFIRHSPRWVFREIGCILSGFIMYFVGCSSIYLMAAISFERFYINYKPLISKRYGTKVTKIVILSCVCLGLFWSLLPIFGWSKYSLEGTMTSCSVEWNERSFNVVSYNLAMFLFVFLIPLSVIITANVKLLFIVKRLDQKKIKFQLF